MFVGPAKAVAEGDLYFWPPFSDNLRLAEVVQLNDAHTIPPGYIRGQL